VREVLDTGSGSYAMAGLSVCGEPSISTARKLFYFGKSKLLTSAGSERDVSTSEESCFSVCVRFREASARARVSRVGFAAVVGSHLHNAGVDIVELDDEDGDPDVHACTEVGVNGP